MNETVLINDDLTKATTGTIRGGRRTAEGYKPTTTQGHVLYEIVGPILNGYLEFTVTGLDHSLLPPDCDQGFVGQYDGRGIEEPCRYLDSFKFNFFRWNLHYRQNKQMIKSVISCADSTPKRTKAMRAVYSGESDMDWFQEPNGRILRPDPAKLYRFRVQWLNKTFVVTVDRKLKWQVAGPNNFAPLAHRIWLGSAPAQGMKYANQLPEITYKSFKLVRYSG